MFAEITKAVNKMFCATSLPDNMRLWLASLLFTFFVYVPNSIITGTKACVKQYILLTVYRLRKSIYAIHQYKY